MKDPFRDHFNHLGGAATVILLPASHASTAAVIAQDDFSGGAVNLGGTTAEVGSTWKATTNDRADG